MTFISTLNPVFTMRPLLTFSVSSKFPEKLERLGELTSNLLWTWNPIIREFLRSIHPELWHGTNHHPFKMLSKLEPGYLEAKTADPDFMKGYQNALAELDIYMGSSGWYQSKREGQQDVIAYFSAEFGLHESVPLYSGGLGVLSGDHTKSVSDLNLPFVGVGLMYQMGYFQQHLLLDGSQQENYEYNDPSLLPIKEVLDAEGNPLRVLVEFPSATVMLGVWKMQVGRITVYLLDTNIAENTTPKYRDIADYLYGGDRETRIMQEIVLGIGGMRALRAMGIHPTVTHCNEGHSAFLLLERTRLAMQEYHLTFREASELISASSVFTTHTPVPAGHDEFPPEMVDHYLASYWPLLGLSRDEFYALGRINPTDSNESFSMTVLALKMTGSRNGVSQLHGEVSREMWQSLWPNMPANETPIIGITNGIHTPTWLSDSMSHLYDEYLGTDWRNNISSATTWARANEIPSEAIWHTKCALREKLILYVRHRLMERQAEMYTRTKTGRDLSAILDPNVLTIGFARRFATYKRATLLFRDHERAYRLFTDQNRPVQLVLAGKAHPKDLPGKEFIKEIFAIIRELELEHRVVFLEDYDMAVARHMVQGCDIWLNTPRRPMEASGTSGMKAVVNGGLNVSIPDGWFPEGYDGNNGFSIGSGKEFTDQEHQDEVESRFLYQLLEETVIPMFYERNETGVPEEWVEMQKHALVTMAGMFSAHRMVEEYAERFYFPASDRYSRLETDNAAPIRDYIQWKDRMYSHWGAIELHEMTTDDGTHKQVGDQTTISVRARLGELSPDEVRIEAFHGVLDADGNIAQGTRTPLQFIGYQENMAVFSGTIEMHAAGRTGVTVRAVPSHQHLIHHADMNLVKWA